MLAGALKRVAEGQEGGILGNFTPMRRGDSQMQMPCTSRPAPSPQVKGMLTQQHMGVSPTKITRGPTAVGHQPPDKGKGDCHRSFLSSPGKADACL